MGNAPSVAAAQPAAAPPSAPTVDSSPKSCPVDHSKMGGKMPADAIHARAASSGGLPAECPVNHGKPAAGSNSSASSSSPPGLPAECPVNHGKPAESGRNRGTVYNVYAQPIDPKNQMPATANQQPAPGQQVPLSTHRVQSSIPKGGTESTWAYPSPQMFWNSLVRKGKADGAAETDMDMVVAIHNEMNERAWRQLLTWEHGLHKGEHLDGEPSLRRFMGMPYTLSPKAQIKSYFGYGFPFDRHDWFVDRNGREVRYVIDYYFNPEYDAQQQKAKADAAAAAAAAATLPEPPKSYVDVPPTLEALAPKYTGAIHVDVRPAVDDVTSLIDRLRLFPQRAVEAWGRPKFRAEGLDPAKAPKEAAALSMLHSSNTISDNSSSSSSSSSASNSSDAKAGKRTLAAAEAEDPELAAVNARCRPHLESLRTASSEEARQSAHVALTYCMATTFCPSQADRFMAALEANAPSPTASDASSATAAPSSSSAATSDGEEIAFEAMRRCVVARIAGGGAAGGAQKAAALK